jgi:DNA-binding transcriptional LysR family regulator
MEILLPMQTFVRVVEAGNFTAVAKELNTTQPTISRQIAALEDHLGVRLITRTTRAHTLSDDGRAFYDHAKRVLEALSEAENSVGKRRTKPSGTLRLSASVVFGRLILLPKLKRFMERYPDVDIDLVLNDGFSDLVGEAIDVAIRIGEVKDPGLVSRKIGLTKRSAVATPAYFKAHGIPKTPQELVDHECLIYTRLATGARWTFYRGKDAIDVNVRGRLHVNSTEAVREAVLAGFGIGLIPLFHFTDEFKTGKLRQVLSDFQPDAFPIQAVYPSRRYVPLKVRAIIDFLADEFRLDPRLSSHEV